MKVRNFDDYFGSAEYSDDCKKLSQRMGNKTTWGGVAEHGTITYILPDGSKTTRPVSTK